jgi:hypothetical protein
MLGQSSRTPRRRCGCLRNTSPTVPGACHNRTYGCCRGLRRSGPDRLRPPAAEVGRADGANRAIVPPQTQAGARYGNDEDVAGL